MSNNYIVVKDRFPTISDVKNDCTSLCVPASRGESLASILQKICAKVNSAITEETDPLFEAWLENFPQPEEGEGMVIGSDGESYIWQTAGEGDTDEKAKVSANDTTAGYLNGKLVEGTGIDFTENNDGGNETLSIAIASSYADNFWNVLGNTGTSAFTNFIGTTDLAGLRIKVNNLYSGYIDPTSNAQTTFGYRALENWVSGVWSTAFGYWALRTPTVSSENTAIGAYSQWANAGSSSNVSVGSFTLAYISNVTGRNVAVGASALNWSTTARENTAIGNFNMLANRHGNYNTSLGSSAMRGNVDGVMNTALGHITLTQNTTNIASINVVSGGSGYTTATVVISAPTVLADPNNNSLQATATAQISGGAIIGITITQAGKGYTNITDATCTAVTAIITGDGTGATLSVTLQSGNNNTAVGVGALAFNLAGSYNTAVGGALVQNLYGNYNTSLGYLADNSTTNGINRTTIGARAYSSQDNSMTLGSISGVNGATADTFVGIGTTAASNKFHLVGTLGFRYVDGNQGIGKVLTDDGTGTGVAVWSSPSGGIGGSTGSTDNSIIRANGTGGSTVQGTTTAATVADDGTGTFNGVSIGTYGGARGIETTGNDLYFITSVSQSLYFKAGSQGFSVLPNGGVSTQLAVLYGGNTAYFEPGNHLDIYGTATMETRLGAGGTKNLVTILPAGTTGFGVTAPTAFVHPAASTASIASLNIPVGSAPSAPNDGDIWREDNTNTGLKVRINGVTKTITVL